MPAVGSRCSRSVADDGIGVAPATVLSSSSTVPASATAPACRAARPAAPPAPPVPSPPDAAPHATASNTSSGPPPRAASSKCSPHPPGIHRHHRDRADQHLRARPGVPAQSCALAADTGPTNPPRPADSPLSIVDISQRPPRERPAVRERARAATTLPRPPDRRRVTPPAVPGQTSSRCSPTTSRASSNAAAPVAHAPATGTSIMIRSASARRIVSPISRGVCHPVAPR